LDRSTTFVPSTDTVTADWNLAYHAGAVPDPLVLDDVIEVLGDVGDAQARASMTMEEMNSSRSRIVGSPELTLRAIG
jgi:hypothetical protein